MIKKTSIHFIWDPKKEATNIHKHGVDFYTAAKAFIDPKRKIYADIKHSLRERRYFCFGKVDKKVLTVRFVYQAGNIRIIGAGYWRKGVRYYDQKTI